MGHFSTKVQIKHIMALLKVTLSALLAVAAASPLPDHPPPAPYHAPHPAPGYAEPVAPPVYNYQYGVNDPHYGPVFSQTEARDNYDTTGEYRVNLPDGRVQIVSYSAGPDGYVADVKYEGEAAYPEEPAYKPAPAPVYKPAPKPVYHPAPVYHKPSHTYHHAPVYHPAPAYKPAHKTYSFKPVEEAPAEKAAEAPAEAPAEEAAAPVEEAAAPAEAAPEAARRRFF